MILLLILLFVIYSCTTNTVKKESLSGNSQKDSISTKYDDSIEVRSHVDKTIGKELSLWMHNKSRTTLLIGTKLFPLKEKLDLMFNMFTQEFAPY